jgi:hypothetical protein
MDRQPEFKAAVKAVRVMGSAADASTSASPAPGSDPLLARSRPVRRREPDSFTAACKEVREAIANLIKFLTENREAYVGTSEYLHIGTAEEAMMSDAQRDATDAEASAFIGECQASLARLEAMLAAPAAAAPVETHRRALVETLVQYLQTAQRLYESQRLVRRRKAEFQKQAEVPAGLCLVGSEVPGSLLRQRRAAQMGAGAASPLSPTAVGAAVMGAVAERFVTLKDAAGLSGSRARAGEPGPTDRARAEQAAAGAATSAESGAAKGGKDMGKARMSRTRVQEKENGTEREMEKESGAGGGERSLLADLDEETRAGLLEENAQILRDVSTMEEAVRTAETRMVELSSLQNVLTENISQQAEKIEQIHTQTVHSAENVVKGNDELKQAAKQSNDFRWFVFGLLMLLSFTLLFLDWYDS